MAPGPNEALPSGNAAGDGALNPAGVALPVWQSRSCLHESGGDLNIHETGSPTSFMNSCILNIVFLTLGQNVYIF